MRCVSGSRAIASRTARTTSSRSSSLEGEGVSLVDLLPQTTLASSKREARDFLTGGAVLVNGMKVEPDRRLRTTDLMHGGTILIRRGKKNWHATKWS